MDPLTALAIATPVAATLGNVWSAHAQKKYQTQMSNTAIQRRVADLKKAGINPIMAAGNLGGASTPPGTKVDISGMASATQQWALQKKMQTELIGTERSKQKQLNALSLKDSAQTQLFKMQAEREKAYANLYKSKWGKMLPYIESIGGLGAGAIGAGIGYSSAKGLDKIINFFSKQKPMGFTPPGKRNKKIKFK